MEAPPEQPLVFRFDNRKLKALTVKNSPFIFFWLASIILLIAGWRVHTSPVVPLLCFSMSSIMVWANVAVLVLNWDNRIEIRNGQILRITRKGVIKRQGKISEITSLIPSRYKLQDGTPNCYYVRLPGKKDIAFDPDIENIGLLIQVLEGKTGKSFKR